jgi:hypothetical protein
MYIRLGETTENSISKKVDDAFNMFIITKQLYKLLIGYELHMKEFMKQFDE